MSRAWLSPHLVGSGRDALRAVQFCVDTRLAACSESKSFSTFRRNRVTARAGGRLSVILESSVLAARPTGSSVFLTGGVGHERIVLVGARHMTKPAVVDEVRTTLVFAHAVG